MIPSFDSQSFPEAARLKRKIDKARYHLSRHPNDAALKLAIQRHEELILRHLGLWNEPKADEPVSRDRRYYFAH